MYDDFSLVDGTQLDGNYGGDLSQGSIHNTLGDEWGEDEGNSLFDVVTTSEITEAGTALCFDKTMGYSPDNLRSWSDSDITFDLHVKPSSSQVGCGTIFSYKFPDVNGDTHVSTLLACDNSQYAFDYDGTTIHLEGYTFTQDIWNHLFFQTELEKSKLQFYNYPSVGSSFKARMDIEHIAGLPFPKGGSFTIGAWNAPELLTYGLGWQYIGCMDEFRIWNTYLTNDQVTEYLNSYTPPSTTDLVHYWRYNEGDGSYVEDLVGGSPFHLIEPPRRAPEWIPSEATFTFPSEDELDIYDEVRDLEEEDKEIYEEFCNKSMNIIESGGNCDDVSEAVRLYHLTQCVFNSMINKDTSYSMETLLNYGEACKSSDSDDGDGDDNTDNPANLLCNNFGDRYFPDAHGESCDQTCKSGKRILPDICECYSGYYGENCDQVCPSGNQLPCGAGTCDKETGTCKCPPNFDTASHCTVCSGGWLGSDCSVAEASVFGSNDKEICSVYSKSHYSTFKGLLFDVSVASEMKMVVHDDWNIYVRQIPCGSGATCVSQVWFELPSNDITIHAIYPDETSPTIYIDGSADYFLISKTVGAVTVQKESQTALLLTHSNGHEVKVTAYDIYLNIIIKMAIGTCDTAGGLCGTCVDGDSKDFQTDTNTFLSKDEISEVIIETTFADFHTIPDEAETKFIYEHPVEKCECDTTSSASSDFDYDSPWSWGDKCVNKTCTSITFTESKDVNSEASYLLQLNENILESSQLQKSFNLGSDVTIEIKVFPITEGVIWSYLTDSTRISLSNADGTLTLEVTDLNDPNAETLTYSCSFGTTPDVWNHISVGYERATGEMYFYVLTDENNVQINKLNVGTGLFEPNGKLSVGGVLPKSGEDASKLPSNTFIGRVDELRIWSTTFEPQDILQNYALDVSTFPHLTTYYKFSEGAGLKSYDSVHSYQLSWADDGSVTWGVSNIDIEQPPTSDSDDKYQVLEDIDKGEVSTNCSTCVNGTSSGGGGSGEDTDDGGDSGTGGSDDDGDSEDGDDGGITDEEAEEMCSQVFEQSSLAEECQDLGSGTTSFYLKSCQRDLISSAEPEEALSAILQMYTENCFTTLDKDDDTLQDLCANMTGLQTQSVCLQNENCKFGEWDETEQICHCDADHWGEKCDQLCPRGEGLTCGGNGVCNATGHCECGDSLTAESNCTQCKPGYSGPFCDYVSSPLADDVALYGDTTCSVFGFGYYHQFRGKIKEFKKAEAKEMYMIRPPSSGTDYEVQVRYNVCYDTTMCIVAVAVKTSENTAIIRAPYISGQYAKVWIDGEAIEDLPEGGVAKESFTLVQDAAYEYHIIDNDNRALITVRVWKQFLNVLVLTNSSYCGQRKSLCGCCESNCRPIREKFMTVADSDSLFDPIFTNSYGEIKEQSGAGFSLTFENTFVSNYKPLKNTFSETEDITIQMFVKPESPTGILLSYSYRTVFMMYLKDTYLCVQIHDYVKETTLQLNIDNWYKVHLIYLRQSNTYELYVASSASILYTQSFVHAQSHVFASGGVLSLGQFADSWIDGLRPTITDYFKGELDDLVIWSRSFVQSEIKSNYRTAYVGNENNLMGLWKFDEGDGDVLHDTTGNTHMWIETYSWSNPGHVWTFSQAPLNLLVTANAYSGDTDLLDAAKISCQELVYSSPLTDFCTDHSERAMYSYRQICIKHVQIAGTMDDTLMTLMALADMCQYLGGYNTWPGQGLCSNYSQDYFPIYGRSDCQAECYFGNYDETLEGCSCL